MLTDKEKEDIKDLSKVNSASESRIIRNSSATSSQYLPISTNNVKFVKIAQKKRKIRKKKRMQKLQRSMAFVFGTVTRKKLATFGSSLLDCFAVEASIRKWVA